MNPFVLLTLSLLFLALASSITIYLVNYHESKFDDSSVITLNFSMWLKLYEICPENWDTRYCIPRVTYEKGNYTQCINISALTAWRYYLWKKRKATTKYNKAKNDAMERFLLYMQSDIDDLRKETEEQINKSMKESQKYINNLIK